MREKLCNRNIGFQQEINIEGGTTTTEVIARGKSGVKLPDLYEYCEQEGPAYVTGLIRDGVKKSAAGIKIKTEKKFGIQEEQFIICKNCGNIITTPERIIVVNEQHIHTFTNPEGFIYDLGCFSLAQGCAVYGEPTLENTWFDGFRWRFSICSSCLIHLGWYYEHRDESFFGLILDRLGDTAKTL